MMDEMGGGSMKESSRAKLLAELIDLLTGLKDQSLGSEGEAEVSIEVEDPEVKKEIC